MLLLILIKLCIKVWELKLLKVARDERIPWFQPRLIIKYGNFEVHEPYLLYL